MGLSHGARCLDPFRGVNLHCDSFRTVKSDSFHEFQTIAEGIAGIEPFET